MSVLTVKNLGKAFHSYRTEWHRVGSWFGLPIKPQNTHRVLSDFSLELSAGEAVGIVGQNGAGKSTFLKLITGTLQPTEGEILIHGQISAILELGMGFHPELTGRENALHTGSLMGHSPSEMAEVISEIEAFAEIGELFDQPVRTYSSGMQMRVAFAVATAFRPEILIVDEALSVGDAYFQHKSFEKIRSFQRQGTTLLIVSHDHGAIMTLCSRAILLDRGKMLKDGPPDAVLDFYNALIAEQEGTTIQQDDIGNGRIQTHSGSGEAKISSVSLLSESGKPLEIVFVGQTVIIEVMIDVKASLDELVVGILIKDRLGLPLFGINTHHLEKANKPLEPGSRHCFAFKLPVNLGQGTYSLSVAAHRSDTHIAKNYEWRDHAIVFEVINKDQPPFVGSAWLNPTITISSEPSSKPVGLL